MESQQNTGSCIGVMLGGAKRILGCSCNEAVRGDMGLETCKVVEIRLS